MAWEGWVVEVLRVRDQPAGVFFSRRDGSALVDGRREFFALGGGGSFFTGWRQLFS
jgi:hypothetical protein